MNPTSQDPDLEAFTAPKVPGTLDYIGFSAAILPFMLSFRMSSSSSVTTTVTDAKGNTTTATTATAQFKDPVAIAGGGVALLFALLLFLQIPRVQKAKRGLRIGLAVGLLALGAIQLLVRGGLLS